MTLKTITIVLICINLFTDCSRTGNVKRNIDISSDAYDENHVTENKPETSTTEMDQGDSLSGTLNKKEDEKQTTTNCIDGDTGAKTETCNKKIDMVIILDASASIGEDNFNLAKDFAKTLSRRFKKSPENARLSLVAYSQYIKILSKFSDDQDESKLENSLNKAFYEASTTGTGKTIKTVNFELFSAKSGSRIGKPGIRNAAVMITDGYSDIGIEFIKKYADIMKKRGIEMFAIGVTERMNDEELTALSSEPVENHLFRLNNSKAVKEIVDKIVEEVCK